MRQFFRVNLFVIFTSAFLVGGSAFGDVDPFFEGKGKMFYKDCKSQASKVDGLFLSLLENVLAGANAFQELADLQVHPDGRPVDSVAYGLVAVVDGDCLEDLERVPFIPLRGGGDVVLEYYSFLHVDQFDQFDTIVEEWSTGHGVYRGGAMNPEESPRVVPDYCEKYKENYPKKYVPCLELHKKLQDSWSPEKTFKSPAWREFIREIRSVNILGLRYGYMDSTYYLVRQVHGYQSIVFVIAKKHLSI